MGPMIKVQDEKDKVNVAKVYRAGQEHIFRFWDEVAPEDRRALLAQIERIDWQHLEKLVSQVGVPEAPHVRRLAPPEDVIPLPRTDGARARRVRAEEAGEQALRAGRVASVVVAGGQGTRLGFEGPKGCFPIGPVTGKSLFHLFAEKIQAVSRRYRTTIPWYVMVSESNADETRAFFQQHSYFGVGRADTFFFEQRELPVVDPRGKLLLASKSRIATSPNGHGGVIQALAESGALDDMARRGCDIVSYFQVDNPLANPADPCFIGHLVREEAEMGGKYVRKTDPREKVGVFAIVDGKYGVVEYSELPREEAERVAADGSLAFHHGNIAIHLFARAFLERIGRGGISLPYHQALKKVPCVSKRGEQVEPKEPNGIKFECFVFDAMKEAAKATIFEVERADEFAPVKNRDGPDSPETARRALSNLYGRWLEEAGARVARDGGGDVAVPIELSPLAALDAAELGRRVQAGLEVTGPFKL